MLTKIKISGFTMIELVVVVAIMSLLLALAMPDFSAWILSSKVRNAAHAVQNGLQLARAEAVRRNTIVRFQLTTSTDGACALSTTDVNWVVSLDDPTGACDADPIDDSLSIAVNPSPRIIQIRNATEGSSRVQANASQNFIAFNGLGRLSGAAPAALQIDFSPVSGTARELSVRVTTGGLIRMCDPDVNLSTTDPQRC